jgi:serine/threonine protein phosphatase 1
VWSRKSANSKFSRPALPAGLRIYAIGDLHGRADLLDSLLSRIDTDLVHRPVNSAIEVYVGDYIDRGPGSCQVLDRLIARSQQRKVVCLKGNHEIFLSQFLANPATLQGWRQYGGLETLVSYGLRPSLNPDAAEQIEIARALRSAIPNLHLQFLDHLSPSASCGDFFFVHAGVKPRVPLAEQREEDLLWIREEFLLYEDDFEKIIVHGHTPVSEPDFRPNRINIDTGAYATGKLTCLRIEADEIEVF